MGFPPPQGLVFPFREGTHKDRGNQFIREFERTLEGAGIPRIHFHDLRHTLAILAI